MLAVAVACFLPRQAQPAARVAPLPATGAMRFLATIRVATPVGDVRRLQALPALRVVCVEPSLAAELIL